jgi:hypothetical protein
VLDVLDLKISVLVNLHENFLIFFFDLADFSFKLLDLRVFYLHFFAMVLFFAFFTVFVLPAHRI